MESIISVLFFDPQCQAERRCPDCGGCVYAPNRSCPRCERGYGDDLV